jgi:membrane protein implicated in regulation of membrane protease activity
MDTIVYIIIITVSMLITSGISSIYFGFLITPNFLCAVLVISVAVYLFYRDAFRSVLGPKIADNVPASESTKAKVKGKSKEH